MDCIEPTSGYGALPTKTRSPPEIAVFDVVAIFERSVNESVHVPDSIWVVVFTVFCASRSIAKVDDVVNVFVTVRFPGFGFVFCDVALYVCAVEYPAFVTVIW